MNKQMKCCKQVDLPGFRFHPTEEELLDLYLNNIVFGNTPSFDVIGMLNIYRHLPWELPGLASIKGEREWYFFVPRDRKHGGVGRPNRTTKTGFWKATGSDRKIVKSWEHKQRLMGLRKTLVFYMGRAPHGTKTDWVMNEYRLPPHNSQLPLPKEVVLCKIYRKATSMKVLEQKAAMEKEEEEEEEATNTLRLSSSFSYSPSPESPIENTVSFSSPNEELAVDTPMKKEAAAEEEEEEESKPINEIRLKSPTTTTSLKLPSGTEQLPQLQLPLSDWTQDSFWMQFNSPWLQNMIASSPKPSMINF